MSDPDRQRGITATHKVYVRAEDERWLTEHGVETGPWVREVVRRSLLVVHEMDGVEEPDWEEYRLRDGTVLTANGDHSTEHPDDVVAAAVRWKIGRLGDRMVWLLSWLSKQDDGGRALAPIFTAGVICMARCHAHLHLHALQAGLHQLPL